MADPIRLTSTRLPTACYLAAGVVVVVLLSVAGRYGFHRDELYFIEGGRHLAWAQPDNPMLVPLLATFWHDLVGGQLWAFRILPALAAGLYCVTAALIARELGGRPRHQIAATVATALTGIAVATGHLFSITTFDLAATSVAIWLLLRAVGDDRWRNWLALGVVAGIAAEIKILSLVVIGCCLLAMLILGPRRVFRTPRLWVAAAIALVLAAPNLIWQAVHDWPMRQIAANIAAGGSASSADRAALIPLQLLMVGPVISAVLVIGVGSLLRRHRRHQVGWVALGYLLMLILVLTTGGKPYYPLGFAPALLAAGTIPLLDWILARTWRRVTAIVLVIISAVTTCLLILPIARVGSPLFQIAAAVNADAAETVGWPGYIRTVAEVADDQDQDRTVIVTSNYGEAGALIRARRLATDDGRSLPPVYSGHNAFSAWGPPPDRATYVIMVGEFPPAQLSAWYGDCRVVTTLVGPPGVDNEEADAPVRLCTEPTASWSQLWPEMAKLS